MIPASIESGTPPRTQSCSSSAAARHHCASSASSTTPPYNVESQWHKLHIGWHSVLGQLKVQKQVTESKTVFQSFF